MNERASQLESARIRITGREIFFSFFIFLLSLGYVGCSLSPSGPSSSKPNLLLVTLDTTRADRIGCYGYHQAETPAIDELAAGGALFEQAIAVAPVTLPSHASLLTGLYPPRHGVRDNADYRLPESETTLAEHLKQNGYFTGAAVGSIILSSQLGLAQGFDQYSEPQRSYLREALGTGIQHTQILERSASDVTDSAISILDQIEEEPFFLWVHYFDPHYDYSPPAPFAGRFSDRLYDGEIAYTDDQLGRLLDEMERRGYSETTLIAVTADHGESLGDHGEETHALFIYEAAIHVPLILKFPGEISQGIRIPAAVSGVDLVPTLLELMGLPPMPGIHGESFAQAARGKKQPGGKVIYAETMYPERAYGWSPLLALRNDKMKFIEAPEPELYDIEEDPQELFNLASERSEDIPFWRDQLKTMLQDFGQPDPLALSPMDSEALDRLGSLGYVSSGIAKKDRLLRPDPKHFVVQHNTFLMAKSFLTEGRQQEARSLLRQVLTADPDNPAALSLYGTLLYSAGQADQGLSQLREAAETSPGVFENQWNFANALHLSGRTAEAAKAYRSAIAIHPFSIEAHHALGNLLYEMKDFQGATKEYQEAIRLGAESPSLHAALGAALADAGHIDDAKRELWNALKKDPNLATAWNKLGIIVEKNNRKEEARGFYAKALEAEPDFADGLFNHAKVSLLLGDLESAHRDVERLMKSHPSYPLTQYLLAHLCIARGDPEGARQALKQFLSQPAGYDARLEKTAKKMLENLEK